MPATPRYVPTPEHIELVRAVTLRGGSLETACAAIGVGWTTFYREFHDLCRGWRVECGRPERPPPKYERTPEHVALVYAVFLRGGTQQDASQAIGVNFKAFCREFQESWREWRADAGASERGPVRPQPTADQMERVRTAVLAGAPAHEARLVVPISDNNFARDYGDAYRVWRQEYLRLRGPLPKKPSKPQLVPPPRPEDIALAEQLVAEGLTQRQIAARMGIHHGAPRFRALKPTFDRLRPERISSKVELTAEQMALGLEMARNGAGAPAIAAALGRSPQSSAIVRVLETELKAAREAQRAPCLVCGQINYDREPTALTCSPACDEERWSKRETARKDRLRAIEAACIDLGIAQPAQRRQYRTRRWRREHGQQLPDGHLRHHTTNTRRTALKAAVEHFFLEEPGG